MKIRQRDCQGEADKYLMLALAHARPEDNLHVVDLPYRPDAPPDMHGVCWSMPNFSPQSQFEAACPPFASSTLPFG